MVYKSPVVVALELLSYGYQEQEIKDNEFVSVESASESAGNDTDDLYDAYTDDGEDE